jgi:hypothetical protein
MEWIASPESSTVTKFGYDSGAQVLDVEYKTGMTYRYFDVPEAVFGAMRGAPSKGQFLAVHIKGVYRYARL